MGWDEFHFLYTIVALGVAIIGVKRSAETWSDNLTAMLIVVGWYVAANATYLPGEAETEATARIGALVAVLFLLVPGWLGKSGVAIGVFVACWSIVDIDVYAWKTVRGAAYFALVTVCLWSGLLRLRRSV